MPVPPGASSSTELREPAAAAPAAPAPKRERKGPGWAKRAFDRGRLRTVLVVALCWFAEPTATYLAAGLALVLLGCALHVWAKGCLRICAEVTTTGPYRWVRNPFYLAALVIEAGYCVAAGVPVAFAVYLVAWYFTYRRTIHREERTLRRLFGERFDEYVRAVPRLFPWRGPVAGLPESRPFDWSNPNLASGREYPRVARILMPPFLFAAAWALRHGSDATSRLPGLLMSVLALVLLEIVRRVAFRRFKQGRRSVPNFIRTRSAHAAAIAAFCAIGFATRPDAFGGDLLVTAGTWLAIGAAILVFGMTLALAFRPPLVLLAQAAACLGAGLTVEQPWLGAVFGTWFVLLAIEAPGLAASPAAPGGGP
jgi:protein-S-isoprenylcysteine O-methyltransferase Ste14